MKVSVVSARSLTPGQRSRWAALQASNPALGSPFFCVEFTMAAGAALGGVEVAELVEGDEVVGFFPFQRGAGSVGEPVGAPLSDYQGVIARPGQRFDPLALLEGCDLRRFEFEHLIACQEPFHPYHEARAPSPYLDLSRGFEAYAAARPGRGRGSFRNLPTLERKLSREVGPVRFEAQVGDPELLERAQRFKSAQYLRTGGASNDRFVDPRRRDLLRRIHAARSDAFAGLLSVLWAGDEVVAAHFGMRSSTVWHWWFPAHDPGFARYSPGVLLLWHVARAAPGLGISKLDLGRGQEGYKARFQSAAAPLAQGRVELPARPSARRVERTGDLDALQDLELEEASLLRREAALGREVRRLMAARTSAAATLAERQAAAERARQSEQIRALERRVSRARADEKRLRIALQALEGELRGVLTSNSWRVTAPLRRALDLIHRASPRRAPRRSTPHGG